MKSISMKYLVTIVLLLAFKCGFSQNYVQWTLKPGTLTNQVDVYLRPNFNFNPGLTPFVYFGQVQFAIGWATGCPTNGQPTVSFTIDPGFDVNGGGTYSVAVFPQSTSITPAGETYNVISLNRIGSGAQSFPAGVEIKIGTVTFNGSAPACTIKIVDYDDSGNDGQANCYATNSALGTYLRDALPSANFYTSPGNSTNGGDATTGYAVLTQNTSLPLKLVSFGASQVNCEVLLNWITAEEVDFNRFEVEESVDGRIFNKIATVNASGSNSGQNKYSIKAGNNNGKKYYRLKMLDNDGKFSYSKVIMFAVSCNGRGISTLIYPNPVNKGTALNMNLKGFSGTINGRLYDAAGKLLSQQVLMNGTNTLATDKLAAGMYQLVIADASGNREVKKIIVAQ